MREWKASGLSCAEFSKRERINPRTLSWWAWRLRADGEVDRKPSRKTKRPKQRPRRAKRAELSFVEVTAAVADDRIEIEVGDVKVRVPRDFDAKALWRVFEVMGRRG